MTSYVTPRKGVAYKFYVALVDQSNTKVFKANPTIASGDFKVSIDGGAFANLATLPSANPGSGRAVMIDLSTSEMNGDNIVVQCVDAAGAEWCDLILNIQTTARQIDDLAYPATTGRSLAVDASGVVDSNVVNVGGSAPAGNALTRSLKGTCIGTVGSASTTTSIVTSALLPVGVSADQFKGRIITFAQDTTTTGLRGQSTDIKASTAASSPVFTVTALTDAPVSGDTFAIN